MRTAGIQNLVTGVVNRLAQVTSGFSQNGIITLSLPEMQAAKLNGEGFNVLLRAQVHQRLGHKLFSLSRNGSEISFELGRST